MASILAIEASAEACSVALVCHGRKFSKIISAAKSHASSVLPMVDELMAQARAEPKMLDAIAYDCGPGAFTGLRIGLSFAQGLALGWNKPLIPVCSLSSLAFTAFEQSAEIHKVVALLDARMGEVYAAVFQREGVFFSTLEVPILCAYQSVEEQFARFAGADTALVGLGVRQVPAQFSALFGCVDQHANPVAEAVLALAEQAWKKGDFTPVEQAELVYLRNSVTWDKHQLRRNRTL